MNKLLLASLLFAPLTFATERVTLTQNAADKAIADWRADPTDHQVFIDAFDDVMLVSLYHAPDDLPLGTTILVHKVIPSEPPALWPNLQWNVRDIRDVRPSAFRAKTGWIKAEWIDKRRVLFVVRKVIHVDKPARLAFWHPEPPTPVGPAVPEGGSTLMFLGLSSICLIAYRIVLHQRR